MSAVENFFDYLERCYFPSFKAEKIELLLHKIESQGKIILGLKLSLLDKLSIDSNALQYA